MVRRYVVAVDGSDAARSAWEWARVRAREDAADCVLVRVLAANDAPGHRSSRLPKTGDARVTVTGSVPEALARFADAADVLVIGTDKTGFAHGRVFGFTGSQIVALAPCSVVIVPRVDLRFRSGVVLGIDRVETARDLALTAAREAARGRGPLHIVQARPRDESRSREGDDLVIGIAQRAIRAVWPDLPIRTSTTARPLAAALLDAAETASLLVLDPGPTHRSGDRVVPGGILMDVLLNVNAPIFVSRPAG